MNKVVIGIISLIAVFAFLFLAYKLTNTSTSETLYAEVSKTDSTDHIKWSPKKKNILVEYSDLQCPACKVFHDFIRSDIEASKSADSGLIKKITFVYRHYPLSQHEHSLEAARSAEAAGKQGKFFEFLDLAFAKQNEWAANSKAITVFENYAKSLGLDLDKFRQDRDSKETAAKIDKDLASGNKFGVDATPSFYLNGKKLGAINSFADFLKPLQAL